MREYQFYYRGGRHQPCRLQARKVARYEKRKCVSVSLRWRPIPRCGREGDKVARERRCECVTDLPFHVVHERTVGLSKTITLETKALTFSSVRETVT